MRNTVLLIENEPHLRRFLNIALETGDYEAIECETGAEGIRLAQAVQPSLIVLDPGLPDMDGNDVISRIRKYSQMPIIVCSARDDEEEIVSAFEHGADDYLVKPLKPAILLAHIYAHLRKYLATQHTGSTLLNGAIRLDETNRLVMFKGKPVDFTPQEYAVLHCLMSNKGRTLAFRDIHNCVWKTGDAPNVSRIREYVKLVRAKLEPEYIRTSTGIGYMMPVMNH